MKKFHGFILVLVCAGILSGCSLISSRPAAETVTPSAVSEPADEKGMTPTPPPSTLPELSTQTDFKSIETDVNALSLPEESFE